VSLKENNEDGVFDVLSIAINNSRFFWGGGDKYIQWLNKTQDQSCQILKTKILICVNFRVAWDGKGWYFLRPFGIYKGHLQ
jgi:hypothetical protein